MSEPPIGIAAAAPIIDTASDAEIETVFRRVRRRLVPFLCILYIANYLDRTNVGMAKLQMLGDLHLSESVYGLGAGIFFIGYFLFEVPSNLIMERVGARRWMARIMLTWGLISASMMFVRGPKSFYLIRFSLGLAEAGFFPGVVFYLTSWFPRRQRAATLAAFLTSTAVSLVIGQPIAGLIMTRFNGVVHLAGWQWLYLLEGIPPILLAGVVLWFLDDRPGHAKWLSPRQRDILEKHLASEHHESHAHLTELRSALRDPRLLMLSVAYFLLLTSFYGFIFWVPTMVKRASHLSNMQVGFVSAGPYLVIAVGMVIIGRWADKTGSHRKAVIVGTLWASLFILLLTMTHSLIPILILITLAGIGIWGALAPFWVLPTVFLRGTAAAGGIAIINSFGALAGFAAPYLMGTILDKTHSMTGSLLILVGTMIACAMTIFWLPKEPNDQHGFPVEVRQ